MMLGTHDGPELVGCVDQGWGQGCTGKMHLFGNLKSTANEPHTHSPTTTTTQDQALDLPTASDPVSLPSTPPSTSSLQLLH